MCGPYKLPMQPTKTLFAILLENYLTIIPVKFYISDLCLQIHSFIFNSLILMQTNVNASIALRSTLKSLT